MSERKSGSMIALLFLALLGLLPAGAGAAEELARGTPINSVACTDDTTQSYALYLPSNYSPERLWPIVYCFDPGGRGDWPVGLFRAAAEKYGYILVGSNNSQNGPWEPIHRAVQAVWTDTQKRFRIDNRRVYSAGHSGGAQVALTFGLFLGRPWAGAIPFCGSLPDLAQAGLLPKDLVVFVSTGLYDFNYWPSRKICASLDALGIVNRLEIFPGGHTWPPGDMLMDALAWLELQAMKKGLQKRDDNWIATQFAARLKHAAAIEQEGKAAEAYEEYRALAFDFRGFCDVALSETAAARLDQPAAIGKYRAALKKAEKEELERFSQAAGTLGAFKNAANERERQHRLRDLGIPGLRQEAEKGNDSPAGQIARRLLGYFFAWAAPAAAQAYQWGDMKMARELYELAVSIQPDRGFAWFNLACVHSRLNDKKAALAALETAVRNGVNDCETIEKEPDLQALHKEPEYTRLLENMKKEPLKK